MNKIIQVINSMIENPTKISEIVKKEKDFYFSYKGYVWSIVEWYDDLNEVQTYALFYYPKVKKVSELTVLSTEEWVKKDKVRYGTKEIKTQEAYESFAQLYSVLKEKYYGLDKMFDEILEDNQNNKSI